MLWPRRSSYQLFCKYNSMKVHYRGKGIYTLIIQSATFILALIFRYIFVFTCFLFSILQLFPISIAAYVVLKHKKRLQYLSNPNSI